MKLQIFAVVVALGTIGAMYLLIRRGSLKEKYTLIWLLAAMAMLALAIFPRTLDAFARLVGVQQGPNLLFLIADVAMTLICVQLSLEASTQSFRSRAVAEEVAILRREVERQRQCLELLTGGRPGTTGAPSLPPAGAPALHPADASRR